MSKKNNIKIKTIFFGTQTFAKRILQGLVDDPEIEVALVVTQPDKPMGRKKVLTPPPVKVLAEEYGIKVEQPAFLKNYELEVGKYDVGVTVQYGLLIPKSILEAPKYGLLNVHGSLLPKYRGASPIQSALINGEVETGVSIMLMDEGLDTGPVLLQKTLAIDRDDTYPILDEKLAKISSEALLEAIPKYVSGELKPVEQDDSLATMCKQFTREDGKIDWEKTSQEIYNQYRGMTPWPGVWTVLDGKRLKLIEIKPTERTLNPGVVEIDGGRLFIGCGEGSVEVFELQLEGKKVMDAKTFVNGNRDISVIDF